MSPSLTARRQARALELHRARLSYREIAAAEDVEGGGRPRLFSGPGRAHDAVQAAKRAETDGVPLHYYAAAMDSRANDLALLDRVQRALDAMLDAGDATAVKAASVLLDLTRRRAAILGTDHEHGLDAAAAAFDDTVRARYAHEIATALTAAGLTAEQEAAFRAALHPTTTTETDTARGHMLALAAEYAQGTP